MQVHSKQGFLTTGWYVLYRTVDEATAERSPEGNVIGAPAPVPPLRGRTATQKAHITRALGHISSTARAGDCVNQASSHHCVNKRCLFCTLKQKENLSKMPMQVKYLQMLKQSKNVRFAAGHLWEGSQCSSIRAEEPGNVTYIHAEKHWYPTLKMREFPFYCETDDFVKKMYIILTWIHCFFKVTILYIK